MSINESSNGEQSSKPWWKQIPIPRYGVAFVIIVLILTALASSFFGADDNPKLSISQAASAEGKTQSLLYPMRDTRWVTDSALPELGSPTSVFQVVPLESGESAATNALKSFAEHFGRSTGALAKADGGTTIIEVTPYDTGNGDRPFGMASLVVSKLSGPTHSLQYSAMQETGFSDRDSGSGFSGDSGSSQGSAGDTGSTEESLSPVVIDPATPTTVISAPQNLPNGAPLIKIARDVLRAAGVDSSDWKTTIDDASTMSTGMSTVVACPENAKCAPQETSQETFVYSRQVVLTPLVDSTPVPDLNWYIEVGDKGVVISASGAWVKAEKIGEYSRRGTQSAITALQAGEDGIGFGMRSESDVYKTTSIDSAPPNAGSTDADSPNRSTFPPNPGPSEIPEPDDSLEPRIVTIKRVEAGYSLQFGAVNGKAASLLVPTYTFFGTDAGSEQYEEQVTLNALDPSIFAQAKPEPGADPDDKPTPEPLLPVEPQTPPGQTEPVPMPEPSLVPLPK